MKLVNLYPLKEANDMSSFIDKVKNLTDGNNHTEAALEIAKFLKNKKYEKVLTHLDDIHELLGNLPVELSKFRNIVITELRKEFAKKYGQDANKKLDSAL